MRVWLLAVLTHSGWSAECAPKDILQQQVEALEAEISAAKERVTTLTKLKRAVATGDESLGQARLALLAAELPPVAELASGPVSTADDHLFLSATIETPEPVLDFRFLVLKRQPNAGPTELLVVGTAKGLLFYSRSGALVAERPMGRVDSIATFASQVGAEQFIVVLHEGRATKLAVSARKWNLSPAEQAERKAAKRSVFLGPEVNLTLTEAWSVEEPAAVAAHAFQQRGQKYVLLGEPGGLRLLTGNGTRLGFTPTGDTSSDIRLAEGVFSTPSMIGVFSPEDQVVQRPCQKLAAVTSVVSRPGRMVVYADGALQQVVPDETCRSEWSLDMEPMGLYALKSVVLGITLGGEPKLRAVNVSQTGASVSWELELGELSAWDALRRPGFKSDLFAVVANRGGTSSLRVWEIVAGAGISGGSSDVFGGEGDGFGGLYKMAMLFGAVMLMVMYQVKKKGKGPRAPATEYKQDWSKLRQLRELRERKEKK